MLIGHQKQWQFLEKSVELERVSHAYLFTGQEKLGKKTLAFEFIRLLFGEDVRKRQHPDFIFVAPEKKEYSPETEDSILKEEPDSKTKAPSPFSGSSGGASIHISQIRNLIWKLSLKPFRAPFKAALIDQAHCMNQEAQNCFLKTLEEPKGNTVLILATEYPELLLKTVISRCEIVKFFPVRKIEIEKYLKKQEIPSKDIEQITMFCAGRPGYCLDFINRTESLENQRKIRKDLMKILNSPLAVRFKYAKNLSQELQPPREVLDLWLRYFRDVFLEKVNGQERQNHSLSKNYSLSKLIKILNLIQKTNFLISRTNVNSKLAIENLMLEL